jgi:hypothetical protein
MAKSFYGNLFSSEPCDSTAVLDSMHSKVTSDMNNELLKPYLDEEIRTALFQMAPLKPRVLTAFPPYFIKLTGTYWKMIFAQR